MEYRFNAEEVTKNIITWIRNWFDVNGRGCKAVIGMSGGKDSSVVAALCACALGPDRVVGVLMPCGEQADIDVARRVVKYLGIKSYEINIGATVNSVLNSMGDINISKATTTNLPARIRMSILYAVAQSINGRVSNNCNLSENWVGYSTRFGDDAGDFSPLSNLTVTEVKQIGKSLGLPDEFINKTPIDGLCGLSDEENLGFTYEVLDKYIRHIITPTDDVRRVIDSLHERNLFKLKPIAAFGGDPNVI